MKRSSQMSVGHRVKSGSSRASKISNDSSVNTATLRSSFLSTLRQVARESHALDSVPDLTLLWSFLSMTPVQRTEAIGLLSQMNDSVGSLYVRSLRLQKYLNCSRTDCTTLLSCCAATVLECEELHTTRCSSTTRSSRKPSKVSRI